MSDTPPIELVLHDLVNASGEPFSPNCWRVREALLALKLPFSTDKLLFTDIGSRFEGRHETLPVLTADGEEISGSWAIAGWLDTHARGSGRSLFRSDEGAAYAAFVTHWVDSQVMGPVWRCIVKDIHDRLHPDDQAYFRRSREERLGGFKLEATLAVRDNYRERARKALEPARRTLAGHDYLAGDHPGYPDMVLHSVFQWTRGCSDYEILEGVDPLVAWLARMDVWLEKLAIRTKDH